MKYVVAALGIWLAGAQSFAAQTCCSDMPDPSKSACGGCAGESENESGPRPDCCTSMEAQKDIDVVLPKNTLPENPIVIEFLPDTAGIASWQPDGKDLIAREASSRAQSPPLYLRNEVLLI